jgi:hypothetical protein
LLFAPSRALAVGLTIGVLTAIGLDDQAMFRASKIDDEPADRKLPAKPVAAQTAVA